MTMSQSGEVNPRKPLRLWPGIVAAVLGCLIWLVPPFVPGTGILAVLGSVACGLLAILWWLFLSRAPWAERIGAIVLMVVAVLATSLVVHQSVSNGMMGRMLPLYSIPVLGFALVAAAVATSRRSTGVRRASILAAVLLGCGLMAVVRTGGVNGDGVSEFHWRWSATPEERLLAQTRDEPAGAGTPAAASASSNTPAAAPAAAPPVADTAAAPSAARPGAEPAPSTPAPAAEKAPDPVRVPAAAAWPGFRGAQRDGVVRGLRIETDWSRAAPVEIWRRPIGPGWSSFAVSGDLAYTQEQRGEEEIVSAYNVKSGAPVWRHRDAVRFYESNGGPGPRGTPAVHNGRVYALGATGLLNALDAASGAVVWSRNAQADTGQEMPGWGFTSSPLVVGDIVVIALSGRLAAYDLATGAPRWQGPTGGSGYSSPHLVTIDGVPQILLLRGSRTIGVSPADGTTLWEHVWEPGVGIVQPAVASSNDVLITVGDAMGGIAMRRIAIARRADGWKTEERWTSRGLKPYFNDFVVHEGHAFGFDGSILACIDLATGERKWKGGRYGHGQMVLLPEQDVMLVLSEEGELALVSATPDKFTEIARVKAIEGKTWNHPVLVGNVLLVRNGEEMAAFRVARAAN